MPCRYPKLSVLLDLVTRSLHSEFSLPVRHTNKYVADSDPNIRKAGTFMIILATVDVYVYGTYGYVPFTYPNKEDPNI